MIGFCDLFRIYDFFCIGYNGWRYAAYRINITNFSAYKYINLWNIIVIFTTNCGMQYERVLYAGLCLLSVSY